MDALHENIAQYVHSGSKPCKQAGAGEFPIGISFEFRAHQVKKSGAPVELVFPKEGLGWDIEATGIMKTSKKMDQAKRLADWMASKEANQVTANWWAVVAYPGVAKNSRQLRETAGQERPELVGQEPRTHPGRVEQALRRQGRGQAELTSTAPWI
jgi:iron(III) transport system substrate-binding protein